MPSAGPVPREIRRLGVSSVRIVWQDSHAAEYGNRYLRDHCPCAECRETPVRSLPVVGQQDDVYPVQISAVGRYAISMQWSDGHDSGIYSYRTLRDLCPCGQCNGSGNTTAGS
jgi:DUF971 family protein